MLNVLFIIGGLICLSFLIIAFRDKKVMFLPIMFSIAIVSIFIAKWIQPYSPTLSIITYIIGMIVPTYFIVKKIRKNNKQ